MKAISTSLNANGLLIENSGLKIRLVTHFGITREDTERAIAALTEAFKEYLPR